MEEPGGYSPWGCKESDTTKRLHFTFTHYLRRLFFFFFSYSSFWGYMSEQTTYPGEPYIVREVIDIEHIDKRLPQCVT